VCWFPPKKAAKKLIKIAPYKPAAGPSPDDTPKARAKGSATIPAVIPPKASPLIFVNNFLISKFMSIKLQYFLIKKNQSFKRLVFV
jgi:hypothetical protein